MLAQEGTWVSLMIVWNILNGTPWGIHVDRWLTFVADAAKTIEIAPQQAALLEKLRAAFARSNSGGRRRANRPLLTPNPAPSDIDHLQIVRRPTNKGYMPAQLNALASRYCQNSD